MYEYFYLDSLGVVGTLNLLSPSSRCVKPVPEKIGMRSARANGVQHISSARKPRSSQHWFSWILAGASHKARTERAQVELVMHEADR